MLSNDNIRHINQARQSLHIQDQDVQQRPTLLKMVRQGERLRSKNNRHNYPWKSWCSDDELIDWAVYTEEVLYYTEWEDESEYQYEEVYGELIEIQ